MSSSRQCEYCGRDLPGLAPEGLCPDCLLGLGAVEWGREDAQSSKARGDARTNEDQGRAFEASGQRLGNYTLLEKIGQGGMGVVYRAWQLNLNRIVAVKLLPFGQFSSEAAVKRFRAEAAAAGGLQHPNIVAIHDVGEHEGQHFFSMDFVEGRTLAEVVHDQPLPARRAAAYLKTIAEAVHYAHQQGILHRDLKPSNILIDAADQPRITDFGLAKRMTPDFGLPTSELTLTGQVLGSPNFMAPEQAAGSREIGPGTDIYSLGALLYHLLTRQPPFQAETLTTLLKQVLETDPVPPRRLNPSIPADLETICLKCLEKEPGRRYATAHALAEDLGRYLDGRPIEARPAGPPGKAWKWCRRRPALAALAGALLGTFLLGLAGVLWQWQRATRLAQAELQQRQRAQAEKYAADMHLAQLAFNDNNRALAITLLNSNRPASASRAARKARAATDPRGWEWRYLWQLCQPDESVTLHRYPQAIKALAVSRDSRLLAVTTEGESALWDLTTRTPLTVRLPGVTGETRRPLLPPGTRALAFSPVEDVLAIGTWDEDAQPVVDLWSVGPGEQTRLSSLRVGNASLSFSPDGKLLAAFDRDGNVSISEWRSDQPPEDVPVPPVRAARPGLVLFSPDGRQVAIAGEYGSLCLMNRKTKASDKLATQTGAAISAVAFSPDAALLAAAIGYEQGTIRLWDTASREPRGSVTKHGRDVTALVFTPDCQRLISASLDGTIRIWGVADLSELRCLQTSGEGLTSLALLEDGKTLVTGGIEGSLCLWHTSRTRPAVYTNLPVSVDMAAMSALGPADFVAETLAPNAVRRFGVAFTPDSQGFVTMNREGTLALWDAHSFRWLEALPFGSNHWSVALSPDGRWLATGDVPGRITVWDWKSRQELAHFAAHFDWWGLLRFSPSSRYLIASIRARNRGPSVRLWRTDTWEEMALSGSNFVGLCSMDMSADDRLLAAGYRNGALKVFHWPSLSLAFAQTNRMSRSLNVSFSSDGRLVATPRLSGKAQVWDLAARQETAVLLGHVGMAPGAAFLPDGRRLVTGGTSARDAVKVWDLGTERELLSLKADGYYFGHVACSPDGNTITATSFNGMAHFWHVPSWEEIEDTEKRQAGPSR